SSRRQRKRVEGARSFKSAARSGRRRVRPGLSKKHPEDIPLPSERTLPKKLNQENRNAGRGTFLFSCVPHSKSASFSSWAPSPSQFLILPSYFISMPDFRPFVF